MADTAETKQERIQWSSVVGSLSLAWSDLRLRARRFTVAVMASSVTLALLLLMTGVVNQLHREPLVTVNAFGGSQWIVPTGADGAFTSSATFVDDASVPPEAGRVLLSRYRLADASGANDLDVILVGHAQLPNDAPRLVDGRLAATAGEVVVSDNAEFSVGDNVLVGPVESVVVGIVSEASVFAGMPLVFVPLDVARELVVGGQPLLSALVVDEVPPLPPSLQALSADTVATDALGPIEKPVSTLRLVQVLLALVATLIIGAVVYLATVDRLRDIAVLRAVGVGSRIVGVGVAAQALVVGLVAALLAVVIEFGLAPVFPLSVYLEVGDRITLVVIAMVVAAAASYGAIRRTLRIDPAEAFSGPGA